MSFQSYLRYMLEALLGVNKVSNFLSMQQNFWSTTIVLITLVEHMFNTWYSQNSQKEKISAVEDLELGKVKESGGGSKIEQPTKSIKPPRSTLNTYDALKVYAIVTMIIDHVGYYGVLTGPLSRWSRCIGRSAAPPFFFLCGYTGSYRFRWQAWLWCLYIWFTVGYWRAGNLEKTFESMHNNLFINFIFRFIPFENLQNKFIHVATILALWQSCSYTSQTLHIPYGTLPYMFALGGAYLRVNPTVGRMYIGFAGFFHCYRSVKVFANHIYHKICIILFVAFITLCMFFFRLKPLPMKKEYSLVRDFWLWISRNAYVLYVLHSTTFRMLYLTRSRW